ncbi:MAG: hypothetical protein L7S64_12930 [Longimicrobiales bacterium]|nr:hypothetical protein [Longimicrobiales bacterium]
MMMMRFAGGVSVAGLLGFIIIEALKILMIPITAWVMGLLAVALKIVLMMLVGLLALSAIGVGVFVYKRSQRTSAEI